MSESCEFRFTVDPPVEDRVPSASSEQHVVEICQDDSKTSSRSLGLDVSADNEIVVVASADGNEKLRPRKLSAPELGRTSSKRRKSTANSYFQPEVHQIARRLSSASPTQNCSCHEPTVLPLDEFLLLHQNGDDSVVIIQPAACLRRTSETFSGHDNYFTGANSKRKLSTRSNRSMRRRPSSLNRRPSRLNRQLPAMSQQLPSASDVTVPSGIDTRRISEGSDVIYAHKPLITDEESEKRRRLIVSVFSAFVVLLIALAVLMIIATLSIRYDAT